ncbi:MAG TPA: sigma-70 family RNA polymerase sigma factor [Anaerolineales bacterium]
MIESDLRTELSIERLARGDRAEFARLVDQASGPVYRLALRMLNNEQDAEDILQSTFLKAWQSLPGFQGRSSVLTWLHRIAVNEALMLIRRRKPQVQISEEAGENAEDMAVPVQLTDWCCLPEKDFLSAESKHALNEAIAALPEKLRVVFVLREIEGFSIQETGQILDLTETAVKTRLLRARLHLRESLSAYFVDRLDLEKAK